MFWHLPGRALTSPSLPTAGQVVPTEGEAGWNKIGCFPSPPFEAKMIGLSNGVNSQKTFLVDTFDGAKPRFLNRGKKRRSVSTLRLPWASDRGAEWVDFQFFHSVYILIQLKLPVRKVSGARLIML